MLILVIHLIDINIEVWVDLLHGKDHEGLLLHVSHLLHGAHQRLRPLPQLTPSCLEKLNIENIEQVFFSNITIEFK